MPSVWDNLMFQIDMLLFYGSLTVIAWLIWRFSRWKHRIPRDRADIPYRAFTTKFDIVAEAREIPALLANVPYAGRPPIHVEIVDQRQRVDTFRSVYRDLRRDDADKFIKQALPAAGGDYAFVVLVDQSGSSANDLISISACLRLLVEACETADIDIAILGYTTVGWHGGKSRRAWLGKGQPRYPGRLCDLLHVVYKPFRKPIASQAWEQFVDASMCRENVDGEALLWAADILRDSDRANKRLILVADGAPVDDATLTANGDGILWRHFVEVVGDIEAANDISFAMVSSHEGPEFVSRHARYKTPAELIGALAMILNNP